MFIPFATAYLLHPQSSHPFHLPHIHCRQRYSLCSVTLGDKFPTYRCARLCCSAIVPCAPPPNPGAICGAADIVLASGVADIVVEGWEKREWWDELKGAR